MTYLYVYRHTTGSSLWESCLKVRFRRYRAMYNMGSTRPEPHIRPITEHTDNCVTKYMEASCESIGEKFQSS